MELINLIICVFELIGAFAFVTLLLFILDRLVFKPYVGVGIFDKTEDEDDDM